MFARAITIFSDTNVTCVCSQVFAISDTIVVTFHNYIVITFYGSAPDNNRYNNNNANDTTDKHFKLILSNKANDEPDTFFEKLFNLLHNLILSI